MGSTWHGTPHAQNVGTFHPQKDVGQICVGRCRQVDAKLHKWRMATRDAVQTNSSEHARHSSDLRCEGKPMRRAHYAEKSGDRESNLDEFLKEGRLNAMGKYEGEGMLQ